MADRGINPQIENEEENNYGVLLYYKYAAITDLQDLFNFYHANCTSLALLGRVRLSSQGVNVTLGGRFRALEKHIEAVKSNALFEGTDFKLASCLEPLDDLVAKECGFTSLSIRIVKELVTLSSHPLLKSPEISNAGMHLCAAEFHSVLQNAGKCEEISDKKLILLDARNLYETRIGKFDSPGVKTLDPEIRQYSDLPSWIDNNSQQLRGNNILMQNLLYALIEARDSPKCYAIGIDSYAACINNILNWYCTGGIRCEMASAYIRSKGTGFENVFQLYGGIQRYMEQFPGGGFFRGKNFVFDHRVSVGSSDNNVLGTCLLCHTPFDDYTSRCRCTELAFFVTHHLMTTLHAAGVLTDGNSSFVCELCQKDGKPVPSSMLEEVLQPACDDHSLNIDQATHLPLSCRSQEHNTTMTKPKKIRILCLHGFRQNASGFKGRTASLAKKLNSIAELVFINAPHELPFIYNPPQNLNCESTLTFNHCNKKFAWLVDTNHDGKHDPKWKMAHAPFDPLQYQHQTEGFEKSINYLKSVFSQVGPFDGILGFSQGAAMASLVSAHREKLKGEIDFRFVILCSGFAVNMGEYGEGSINCPSLHIFGNREGQDRQINCEASRQLASLFEEGCSVIIEHDLGHIIPTRFPYIAEIKDFLQRFQ